MAMAFDSEKYIHDADKAALKALKAIPGFSALVKAFMNVWNERQQKILNMSSRIKISEKQMRKYYDMLPPICEKLGIPVPELFLEMNVVPNSYTSGDTEPFIVITSGLLKTLPEELIPTILAHECGHIACHHVLYLTMGRLVLQGAGSALSSVLPIGGLLTVPLQVAFYYWMRCSEFSADRVAVLCDGTDRKMQEVCMRMAGWDKEIDAEVSLEAFLDQATDYKEMINESKWNKVLEFLILSQASHPLMAVRATECRNWYNSIAYQETINHLVATDYRFVPAPQVEYSSESRSSDAISSSEPLLKGVLSQHTIMIPSDYKQLTPKPTDPQGSTSFGRVNTQSNSFIQIVPISIEESVCNKSKEEIIASVHSSLSDDEGIIAVECGTSLHGRKYAYSMIKTLQQSRSIEYKVTMHFEADNSATAVIGYFMEIGSPGFREASIKGQVKREQQIDSEDQLLWSSDPYDSTISTGVLMNESEKEKYDFRFPLHPLTEARSFIKALIKMN